MSDFAGNPTPGPWAIHEYPPARGPGYVEIRGPNDEAICTFFPDAGRGGVGYRQALANARLVLFSANEVLR